MDHWLGETLTVDGVEAMCAWPITQLRALQEDLREGHSFGLTIELPPLEPAEVRPYLGYWDVVGQFASGAPPFADNIRQAFGLLLYAHRVVVEHAVDLALSWVDVNDGPPARRALRRTLMPIAALAPLAREGLVLWAPWIMIDVTDGYDATSRSEWFFREQRPNAWIDGPNSTLESPSQRAGADYSSIEVVDSDGRFSADRWFAALSPEQLEYYWAVEDVRALEDAWNRSGFRSHLLFRNRKGREIWTDHQVALHGSANSGDLTAERLIDVGIPNLEALSYRDLVAIRRNSSEFAAWRVALAGALRAIDELGGGDDWQSDAAAAVGDHLLPERQRLEAAFRAGTLPGLSDALVTRLAIGAIGGSILVGGGAEAGGVLAGAGAGAFAGALVEFAKGRRAGKRIGPVLAHYLTFEQPM